MKTKNKILNGALGLFNEHGVSKITTRGIASEIGISQGNLHYHYPNKEAVITVLLQQFIAKIEDAAIQFKVEDFSRKNVLDSMVANYQIMHDYRFLFIDSSAVWRLVPDLKIEILGFIQQKRTAIQSLIEEYKKIGLLRAEISDDQIAFLANQFTLTITSWLTGADYLDASKDVHYFARFTFRIWLPYLSESEMIEWEKVLQQ